MLSTSQYSELPRHRRDFRLDVIPGILFDLHHNLFGNFSALSQLFRFNLCEFPTFQS